MFVNRTAKGEYPMKNNEIDVIYRHHNIKTGNTKWSDLERVNLHSDGDQKCFYCNFSLECGQQECIWRED
jgi:hypothetical protein